MSVVLVTVVGPTGPIDVAVPADQPLTSLLDPLARTLGHTAEGLGAPPDRWSLAPLGGDALPLDQSLTDHGIADGAVLVLFDGQGQGRGQGHGQGHGQEQEYRQGWGRGAVVGVLSAAGGMGRTSVAALLSEALAVGGGGLTVAVDAHPGAGSLDERVDPGHDVDAGDLLAVIDHPALTSEELLGCLARSGRRLALPAARKGRGRGPPLTRRDWGRLVRGLATHGLTVVIDCGPGLGDPGARAALANADQVVLVVEQHPSAASRWMARTLANQGLPAVAVPWPAPARWERRLAEALVGDWTALGIVPGSAQGRAEGTGPDPDGEASVAGMPVTRRVARWLGAGTVAGRPTRLGRRGRVRGGGAWAR